MTSAHEPHAGDRYDAPWGRYTVLRCNADASVTLQDLDRPTACVRPSRAKLAAEYSLVQAAQPVLDAPPLKVAPAPWVEPLETCSDCQRQVRIVFATDDPAGPKYCCQCLSTEGSRGWRAPATRGRAGGGDAYASRAELGSFARPSNPTPRPKPAPPPQEAVRDLWAEISRSVAR